MEQNEQGTPLGREWEGLEPDSHIWTEGLLTAAAAEIAGRDEPTATLERPGAAENAEIVRLRCELARLKQDYGKLDRKYANLLVQFQSLAGRRRR